MQHEHKQSLARAKIQELITCNMEFSRLIEMYTKTRDYSILNDIMSNLDEFHSIQADIDFALALAHTEIVKNEQRKETKLDSYLAYKHDT